MEANEAIVNAVANNSRPPFWLGLVSTPEKPSTFRYMSDGLRPYFTNWDPAQPDNDKGIEYCSQITYKGRYVFTLRCQITVESKKPCTLKINRRVGVLMHCYVVPNKV